MKCLIIAAGRGSRLQLRGNSKPLIPIFGVPLIERVIKGAREAGATEFFVVTGFRAEEVRAFLGELAGRESLAITPVHNSEWEKDNGLSVLKARDHLNEPFLLLMADHIFDPGVAREMISRGVADGEINLGVDRKLDNPQVNLDDVTKVATDGGKIRSIGKELTEYDCFDTGIFVCTPAIFEALERAGREHGDTGLSAGVRILAEEGRANAVEISGDYYWVDVDDPDAFRQAESVLLERLKSLKS